MYLVLINTALPEECSDKLASSCLIKNELRVTQAQCFDQFWFKKKISQLGINPHPLPHPYLAVLGKGHVRRRSPVNNRRDGAAMSGPSTVLHYDFCTTNPLAAWGRTQTPF